MTKKKGWRWHKIMKSPCWDNIIFCIYLPRLEPIRSNRSCISSQAWFLCIHKYPRIDCFCGWYCLLFAFGPWLGYQPNLLLIPVFSVRTRNTPRKKYRNRVLWSSHHYWWVSDARFLPSSVAHRYLKQSTSSDMTVYLLSHVQIQYITSYIYIYILIVQNASPNPIKGSISTGVATIVIRRTILK